MSNYNHELLVGLLPAIVMFGVAAVLGVYSLVRRDAAPGFFRLVGSVGACGGAGAIFVEAYRTRFVGSGSFVDTPGTSFMAPGAVTVDRLTLFGGIAVCAVALFSGLLSESVTRRHPRSGGLYHSTLLVAAAAGYLLLAQHDMTTLVPAVITLVIAVTVLCAVARTDRRSIEASLNTTVILGVSVAVLLYGLALVYGVTGSTDTYAIGGAFSRAPALSIIGVSLTLIGLLSLSGILPFQRWFVDVADAVPAPTAGAALALIVTPITIATLRIAALGWGTHVAWWRGVAGAVLVLAALYAAVMAARQTSVRGLVAYTLSGQIAVGLGGLLALGPSITGIDTGGGAATLFQLAVLSVSIVAAFAAIAAAEDHGIPDSVRRYQGLATRLGAGGAAATLALLSLVGLPPFGLFIAHLLIWQAAMSAGYAWLVALLAIATVLLTLPPVKLAAALFSAAGGEETNAVEGSRSRGGRIALIVCCVAPLLATVLVQPLMVLTSSAAGVLAGH